MQTLLDFKGEPYTVKYDSLRTMTGLTLDRALKRLNAQLEPGAYKKVKIGGVNLTDIKPAYLTEALTDVFGLCGIGWHFGFDTPVITAAEKQAQSGRKYTIYQADITYGWLVYRLVDEQGRVIESEQIRATGGSDNETQEFAIRGAVTSMLGAAASKLCWQLFIYKGQSEPDEKDEGDEKKEAAPDNRPWYERAYDYATHKANMAELLKDSEPGRKVIGGLGTMKSAEGWWSNDQNMINAMQKYTGKKSVNELTWANFCTLKRAYAGPHALVGGTMKDVLYQHYFKPSEWQNIMAAIPVLEDMVLTAEMADALNAIIPAAGTFIVKGKGLDTEAVAANLRRHLLKLAVDETPTSELVKAVESAEETTY